MRLDERMPILVSKFKSFSTVFCQKGVKCYPIWILGQELESSYQGASFTPQNERALKTLSFGPARNFKTSVLMRTARMKTILEEIVPLDSECFSWSDAHRNASENHISPDPVNLLTKAEIWDTLLLSPENDIPMHGFLLLNSLQSHLPTNFVLSRSREPDRNTQKRLLLLLTSLRTVA